MMRERVCKENNAPQVKVVEPEMVSTVKSSSGNHSAQTHMTMRHSVNQKHLLNLFPATSYEVLHENVKLVITLLIFCSFLLFFATKGKGRHTIYFKISIKFLMQCNKGKRVLISKELLQTWVKEKNELLFLL